MVAKNDRRNLVKLHRYVWGKVLPVDFEESKALLAAERQLIDIALSENRQSAYGFTTLFGPNDNVSASSKEQNLLLKSHLLGQPEELDKFRSRAIIGAKLLQISLGGSGLSTDTFVDLYNIAGDEYSISIPSNLSYGSGDVVPGAWVVYSVFGCQREWNSGDIISLINGNYISTAYAYMVLHATLSAFSRFLCMFGSFAVSPPPPYKGKFFGGIFDEIGVFRSAWNTPPQLPVSIRDMSPILEVSEESLVGLASHIDKSLGRPSANPLFSITDKGVECYSQSSFMNFGVRFALASVNDFICLMSSYVQRSTEYLSRIKYAESNSINLNLLELTQAPKVSEALRIQIESNHLPRDFSGSMSGGVEDIWDTALMSSNKIFHNINILESQLNILEKCIRNNGDLNGCNFREVESSLWEYLCSNKI